MVSAPVNSNRLYSTVDGNGWFGSLGKTCTVALSPKQSIDSTTLYCGSTIGRHRSSTVTNPSVQDVMTSRPDWKATHTRNEKLSQVVIWPIRARPSVTVAWMGSAFVTSNPPCPTSSEQEL